MANLKVDLEQDEVFVFTPKGKVISLPIGATPVDFAYAIHTEVGHRCVGGRVDGKLVPLDFTLSSGQTVEVVTSKTSNGPSRDWLKMVVTPRARTKIRQWFTKERREEALQEGRDALSRALRRGGLPVQKLMSEASLLPAAKDLKFSNIEALYVEIGEGRISPQTVVSKLVTDPEVEVEELPPVTKVRTKAP
jgi:GTP pyrophosphokinase